jgi:hypothetical protein
MRLGNQWRYGVSLAACAAVFGLLIPFSAFAATLSLSPAARTVSVGQTFTATIEVSSAGQAMNAVSADISFPSDKVRVLSVSQTNSVVNFWVQNPSFSNDQNGGDVNLQGVVLSPGFTGVSADVVDIVFQAVAPGTANVSFSSGSVLANDGAGTNILTSMSGSVFTIASASEAPPKSLTSQPTAAISGVAVTSVPSTQDDNWYSINNIQFDWNMPIGADGVWYAFSSNPSMAPSVNTVANQATSVSYDLSSVSDGIWYFMISSENNGIWSPVVTKTLRLDRTQPEPFTITRTDSDPADTLVTFTWLTTDALSGLSHYEIKIGNGNWFNPENLRQGSSYVIPQSTIGKQTLAVRAIDNAGNVREEDTSFMVVAPGSWQEWLYQISRFSLFSALTILLIVILFVILYYLLVWNLVRWKRKAKRELREFEEELHGEIGKMESGKGKSKSPNGDLRSSTTLSGKRSIENEVKHLAEVTEEKIEKLNGKK